MPSSSNAFYLAICLFLRLAICLFLLMLWMWYFENESTELDCAGQVDETINFWVMSGLTSSFTCHLISDITTLIIHHSFTLSLLAQNLPFQQIIPTLDFFYPGLPLGSWDWTGPDLSSFSIYFQLVFSLIFLFVLCGGLGWLHGSFLLHVIYSISYLDRIGG